MSDESREVAIQDRAVSAVPASELSVAEVVARVQKVKQIKETVMEEGVHFGIIPGTTKPTLYQPGADILCMAFMLDPQYEHETVRDGLHREVTTKCTLFHIPTGVRVASGEGSCSTYESKYAWRPGGVECPECGEKSIKRGRDFKDKTIKTWYCDRKSGGCGQNFPWTDKRINGQNTSRQENPDLPDTWNTVLKISNKRARMAAVLTATGGNELFTADLEDYEDPANAMGSDADAGTVETKAASKPPPPQSNATRTQAQAKPPTQQQPANGAQQGASAEAKSPEGSIMIPIKELAPPDQAKALGRLFSAWRELYPGRDTEMKAPLQAFCKDVLGYEISTSKEIRVRRPGNNAPNPDDLDKVVSIIQNRGTWVSETGETHRLMPASVAGEDIDPGHLPSDGPEQGGQGEGL
jgi:hypothetical protein